MKTFQKISLISILTLSFLCLELTLSSTVKSQDSTPTDSNSKPTAPSSNIGTVIGMVAIAVGSIGIVSALYSEKKEKPSQDPDINRLKQEMMSLKQELEQKLDSVTKQIITIQSTGPDWQNMEERLQQNIDRKLQVLDSNSKVTENQPSYLEHRLNTIEQQIKEFLDQKQSIFSRSLSPKTSSESISVEPVRITDGSQPVLSDLPPEIQVILNYYHSRYSELEQESVKVEQNGANYNQREQGITLSIIFEKQNNNYKFLVINDCYLVPKSGSKVNTFKYKTMEDIFECKNFYSGAPFKVIEPAIVSPIENDRWRFVTKGKLEFI